MKESCLYNWATKQMMRGSFSWQKYTQLINEKGTEFTIFWSSKWINGCRHQSSVTTSITERDNHLYVSTEEHIITSETVLQKKKKKLSLNLIKPLGPTTNLQEIKGLKNMLTPHGEGIIKSEWINYLVSSKIKIHQGK